MKPKKNAHADDQLPNSWERFEFAVDVALRTSPINKTTKKSLGRLTVGKKKPAVTKPKARLG